MPRRPMAQLSMAPRSAARRPPGKAHPHASSREMAASPARPPCPRRSRDLAVEELAAAEEVEAGRCARPQLVIDGFGNRRGDPRGRAADDPRHDIALGDAVARVEEHLPHLAAAGRGDRRVLARTPWGFRSGPAEYRVRPAHRRKADRSGSPRRWARAAHRPVHRHRLRC